MGARDYKHIFVKGVRFHFTDGGGPGVVHFIQCKALYNVLKAKINHQLAARLPSI